MSQRLKNWNPLNLGFLLLLITVVGALALALAMSSSKSFEAISVVDWNEADRFVRQTYPGSRIIYSQPDERQNIFYVCKEGKIVEVKLEKVVTGPSTGSIELAALWNKGDEKCKADPRQ